MQSLPLDIANVPMQPDDSNNAADIPADAGSSQPIPGGPPVERPIEIGGRPGPDPTRYGDWEKNGRCIDF